MRTTRRRSDEGSFLDFAGANAGSTNADALSRTFDKRVHGLKIQIPAALADVMGVTDPMPELWPTTTDFTNLCHKNTRPLSSLSGPRLYFSRASNGEQPAPPSTARLSEASFIFQLLFLPARLAPRSHADISQAIPYCSLQIA